jgi:hypothetical protein
LKIFELDHQQSADVFAKAVPGMQAARKGTQLLAEKEVLQKHSMRKVRKRSGSLPIGEAVLLGEANIQALPHRLVAEFDRGG